MAADKLHGDRRPPDRTGGGESTAQAPRAEPGGGCLDVVVVSADMGAMTLACVAALEDPLIERVIVVDNAFDADRDERAALARHAVVVPLERRLGFAAANNRGLAAGSAEFVLLLNSDILVVPGAIGTLLDGVRNSPGAVAAGGRLVDPDTLATQPGYRPRPFPTLANFLVILLGIEERWPGNPVTRRYHGAAVGDDGIQDVAQPAAAALLARRDALEAVGGFDERFWFWFEDSDLLLRLSALGRILYVPGAVFRHLGGGTFARWDKSERIRSAHHGILHFGDAHLARSQRALLGAVTLAVSLPRLALFSRTRPREAQAWRAVARGGLALLGGRPVGVIAPGPPAAANPGDRDPVGSRSSGA